MLSKNTTQSEKKEKQIMLAALEKFRKSYDAIFRALPFYDCYISDLSASWDDVPQLPPTPYCKLTSESGTLRLVIHTETSFDQLEAMAEKNPQINYIIASGNQKLMYHVERISGLIKDHPNIFLCTANLCNVMILEELVAAGLSRKILYGSMMPYLDYGQAAGPLVLGNFDWQSKCDIAGNNLRRLLGETPVSVPEVPLPEFPKVFIDAHGHTIWYPETPSRFPAPDCAPVWEQWQARLDFFGITHFLTTPGEAISDVTKYAANRDQEFYVKSGGRVRYFEVFDPRHVDVSLAVLARSLPDPFCIGIKIHPAEHTVDGDDPRYEAVFSAAAQAGKPIMTHSWGVSDYNPRQKCASPERFDKFLSKYPAARFVLGHTGGRPNGYIHALEMCRKHPQCMTDLAGDLFNNGHLKHAVKEIGAGRIMFATDMYWIDPRCTLGILFAMEDLDNRDLLKILRLNAEKFYLAK